MARQAFCIAIACSHSADCLSSTLRALVELEYPRGFEVLVIDDGRRAGRREAALAAKDVGLSIRYLGVPGIRRAAAWNTAIHEAASEYLALLEDGCVPSPDWLSVYDEAFEEWTTGIVGGPDHAVKNAGIWERTLDGVLNSLPGSLGVRTGRAFLARYYPRPWNMAARTEALRLAGGFDEDAGASPEVPMISRLIRLAFRTRFEPRAAVARRRDTNPIKLIIENVRLGAVRGLGVSPPGIRRAYGAALIAAACALAAVAHLSGRLPNKEIVMAAVGGYGAILALSSAQSALMTGSLPAVVLTPMLMAIHHISHLLGYAFGLSSRTIACLARER